MKSQGHHAGHRSERIAEEVRNEVSLMLAGELKDPRLAAPVMVTEVRLGAGMRHVRGFVSLIGEEVECATFRVFVSLFCNEAERPTTLAGLQAATGFFRHELVDRLHLRRAPDVIFMLDQTEEIGNRIESLLRKAKTPEAL